MVQVTQTLAAGGLLISPTEADLRSAGRSRHRALLQGRRRRGRGAHPPVQARLGRTGTQFGQRMLHYERYYAGDPVRVSAAYWNDVEKAHLFAMVQRALAAD